MANILKLNGSVLGDTSMPTPVVEISESITHRDGFGTQLIKHVTWRISGCIVGSNCLTILTTLVSTLTSAPTNSKFEYVDGSTYAVLDGSLSTCIAGISIGGVSYPTATGRERISMLHFSFTVTGDFSIGASWKTINRSVTYDTQGLPTITYAGRFCNPSSSDIEGDCKTWARSVIPAPGSGISRIVISERYTEHMLDTTFGKICDYEITEKELWLELPAGVSSFEYTIKTTSNGPGPKINTYAGKIIGKNRDNSALLAAYVSMVQAFNNVKKFNTYYCDDPVSGSVEWAFSYLNDSRTTIMAREEITQDFAVMDFVMLSRLDATVPIKQDTVKRPCTITQRGTIITKNDYADIPAALYASNIKSKRCTKSTINSTEDEIIMYQIDYEYTYVLVDNP